MPKLKKLTPKAEAQSESTSLDRLRELAQDPKLAKLVAANYMAPPDLLEELSHTSDKPLLKALVSNPNTPTEVLLKLGSLFPEQLLDNPVFDILLIENPNLLSEFPKSSLNSLLKREVAPVSFLRWAATNGDENTLQSLLINPNVPAEVVQGLTEHGDWDVVIAAKLHVNSGVEVEPSWEEQGLKRRVPEKENERVTDFFRYFWPELKDLVCLNYWIRRRIASHPNCPVDVLAQLALDDDLDVRICVAKNPNCPVELRLKLLTQLALDDGCWVRICVAENPNCPVDVLTQFALDNNSYVRRDVASNLNCPVEVLTQLALDDDYRVRRDVASNPNCPVDVLTQLALDNNSDVRIGITLNLNCPVDVLTQLALDNNSDVRIGITLNPNCPVELRLKLLTQLALDNNSDVRIDVTLNPNCPVEVLTQLALDDSYVRRGIALNLNCPVEVLTQLALDNNSDVRRGVASNPNCPVEVLTQLALDNNSDVRRGVASNPNCPVEVLTQLALDNNSDVRRGVASNLNCPPADLIVDSFLEQFTKSSIPTYPRLIAFRSPHCPTGALAKNYRSRDWLERCAIAEHPKTPDATLQKLLLDGNRLVRQKAQANLEQRQNIIPED
ncbi:hypothetical protein H6G37_12060 [Synechocystis sp. FACHB-898]|uniref:hypothetical protein n=1 Tax=unclassified Synechocystis TaxID=2640012 RepID=UPI001686E59E|nr:MULTISPECIES: hypothetical protein [unclassified Synechocystis]MBD2618943.1 hypothetical protein [Synechocystis sp. FACHB-898]MBD2637434.1 hypothetical protein [Synechocystis sp. FACHB-908]MBD2661547.1 hypothetical protein [Synechocystis sp. FACHB-929]